MKQIKKETKVLIGLLILFFLGYLALVYFSRKEDPKAIKLIKEANSFLNQKNYSSALLAFKNAQKYDLANETKAKNFRNISICFLNLKEEDSAKLNAKKAYETADENSYFFHNNKGEYLLLNKKEKEALTELKMAYEINSSGMEVNNNLSLIYSGAYSDENFNLNKALEHAQKAYSITKNATNKEQLAGVYFQLEKFNEAAKLFSELNNEFPQVKMYQFNYGQALYFSGKEDEGIALMEDAAERDELCRELFEELINE